MAMRNPVGRVNYEPNQLGADGGRPREDPARGFRASPRTPTDPSSSVRSETFADHYSQARQFFVSQTPIEQKHIGDALVFELSKVERPDIRSRTVSHLRNIDAGLAATVADGSGPAAFPMPPPRRASRASGPAARRDRAQHRQERPATASRAASSAS